MKADADIEEVEAADQSKHGNDYPALTIDWQLYEKYLDDPQLTDGQKREFIEALWYIIVAFVDLGFGVHPVQHVLEACGPDSDLCGGGEAGLLSSWDKAKSDNPQPAGPDDHGPAERKET